MARASGQLQPFRPGRDGYINQYPAGQPSVATSLPRSQDLFTASYNVFLKDFLQGTLQEWQERTQAAREGGPDALPDGEPGPCQA